MLVQFSSKVRNVKPTRRQVVGRLAGVSLACCLLTGACAEQAPRTGFEKSHEEQFVTAAAGTVQAFSRDPNMGEFRALARRARAMLIVPETLRAAFLFGVESGGSVLVVRGAGAKTWRGPAFYAIDSASIGLQMGADASELIFLVMTDRGLASFHRSSLKLGVDASIAAGSDGNRIGADTSLRLSADIVVFARSKGAFMGISLEEAVVRIVDSANETYYGRPLRPAEIFTAETTLPHSLDLLQSVEALTR
jgi:lipid-binding SYLF domain-containing protein